MLIELVSFGGPNVCTGIRSRNIIHQLSAILNSVFYNVFLNEARSYSGCMFRWRRLTPAVIVALDERLMLGICVEEVVRAGFIERIVEVF